MQQSAGQRGGFSAQGTSGQTHWVSDSVIFTLALLSLELCETRLTKFDASMVY